MRSFMFATGIENSYPVISTPNGGSKRMDEMHKCCHYKCFQEDFSPVRELGSSMSGMDRLITKRISGRVNTIGSSRISRSGRWGNWSLRRSSICVTSVCPTGLGIFRTENGRSCSPNTRRRLHNASRGSLLHPRERDLHCRNLLSAVGMVK
jgi:hypothetical protein